MTSKYNIKNDTNIETSIYFNTQNSDLDDIMFILEENTNINVHPNSEDRKTSYTHLAEYIHRIVTNSKFLCKGLDPDYVMDSFEEADAIVVIGSSMNILPNGNIFGFASIQFDQKKNQIYIDVICSHIGIKGAGDVLIKAIEKICKEISMTEIKLTSVKSAISFYEKYKFIKKDDLCDDMCWMIKKVKKNMSSKDRSPKSRSKSQKSQKSKSQKSKNRSQKSRSKSRSQVE